MILPFRGRLPELASDVYLARTAVVIGDVVIRSESSVWYGTVVRGDVHSIRIGARTNVQDNCVLHVTGGTHALIIGDDVSIGHGAVVHGCTIESRVLVSMGAIVLDGARVGADSIVGAGAVVPEGAEFPPRSILLGIPARRHREAAEEDRARILKTRDDYIELTRHCREEEP